MADAGRLSQLVALLKSYSRSALRRYRKLNTAGKAFMWFLAFFYAALTAVIVVLTPARIAQFFYDLAQEIGKHPLGWLILGGVMVLVSFPPFFGFTTATTLCGFAYGMRGFFIAASATLLGSAIVFVVLRLLFARRLRTWSESNERWQTLESIVQKKGLPLLILIRVSPFPPWVYSNTFFASIQSVSLFQFLIATCFVLPRVLLAVFIGNRLAVLSDGEQRRKMDTQTKIINAVSILISLVLGLLAGYIVYNQMQKQVRLHVRREGGLEEGEAEEVEEEVEEGAPLLVNVDGEREGAREGERSRGYGSSDGGI